MATNKIKKEIYDLLNDCYYGDGGFEDGSYIIPHIRESSDKLNRRRDIAYYLNYVQPVVNSHVDPIFKTEPKREWNGGATALWELFLEDADLNKTALSRFMKRAGLAAKLFGVCFIVMDNFPDQPINMMHVVEERKCPYVTTVLPQQVTKYQTDQYGRLILLSYTMKQDEKEIKYTWTDTEWQIEGDKETSGSGAHNLGRIPVIPLYSRIMEPGKVIPMSDFYSIARTNKRIYNLCSELDEILRNQAFSILTYPGEIKDIQLSTENALGFKNDSSHAPAFIAPPSEPATLLMDQTDRLVKEIYRMAMLTHVTGIQQQTSGVAKAWDFEQTNTALSDFANNCEAVEKEIAALFSLWTGSELDYQCKYSDDYSIQDVEQELSQCMQALDLQIGGKFDIEVKKKAAAAYLQDIETEDFDQVIADIEVSQEDANQGKVTGGKENELENEA